MKALLVKDLRLILRQQRGTVFMFMAIVMLIIGATDNPMFGILYTVFLLPSMLLSTIAYDTFDNGMTYIMALPFSIKGYVAEKYVLIMGGAVIINVLATGLTAMVQVFKGGVLDITELLIYAITAQCVVFVYSAIIIPVNMRYGTEKGRIILIIVAIAIGALIGGSGSLLEFGGESGEFFVNGISQYVMVKWMMAILAVSIGICIISYYICIKWMGKKEY